jgi:uncharacterized protein involved in exopolysaccharide biosynthesis
MVMDDEIDLKELFMVLWSGKWLVSAITGVAAVVSVASALMLPNIYTANTLLAPAEQSGGGMGALMQQYGGLASLAGVSLPGGDEASRAQLGMALMTSRGFIGEFVERRKIMPELMAVDAWNLQTDEVSYDPEVFDSTTGEWVREVEAPFEPKPSSLEAHEAFKEILGVSQDKQTGYVTVSIDHKSPTLAAQWVNWLVEDVNAAVKAQDVAEAEKSIEYLREQVTNTSLADLQAVFFDLIQSQTETVMLAEVRQEYVFKTIDPAVAPEEKSKPSRVLICVMGTLLGGMLGVFIVLIRHYAQSESEA